MNMDKQGGQEKVVADLNNYFLLKASFKNQITNCLVLKDTMKSTGTNTAADSTHAETLANLLYILNNNQYGKPVLNESNADTNLMLPLTGNETIEEINAVLVKHGLIFLKLNRNVEMLTLTEIAAKE